MRLYEIIELKELASSGTTSSGNVANAIVRSNNGSIGAGFDPDASYGIYPKPSKRNRSKKPSIIRRILR